MKTPRTIVCCNFAARRKFVSVVNKQQDSWGMQNCEELIWDLEFDDRQCPVRRRLALASDVTTISVLSGALQH